MKNIIKIIYRLSIFILLMIVISIGFWPSITIHISDGFGWMVFGITLTIFGTLLSILGIIIAFFGKDFFYKSYYIYYIKDFAKKNLKINLSLKSCIKLLYDLEINDLRRFPFKILGHIHLEKKYSEYTNQLFDIGRICFVIAKSDTTFDFYANLAKCEYIYLFKNNDIEKQYCSIYGNDEYFCAILCQELSDILGLGHDCKNLLKERDRICFCSTANPKIKSSISGGRALTYPSLP